MRRTGHPLRPACGGELFSSEANAQSMRDERSLYWGDVVLSVMELQHSLNETLLFGIYTGRTKQTEQRE